MSEATKHTPGPWKAHDDDGTGTEPCVLSEHGDDSGTYYVATCHLFANAVLIAMAPQLKTQRDDLLAACKRLASSVAFYCPQAIPNNLIGKELRARMAYAQAAVDKVEGPTP